VDYQICDIEKCSQDGICVACKECKQKVLKQEAPGEAPVQLGMCQGCATCLTACPLNAIRLM
jgi:NAD-dependent dihydropyrimidine dehydrogenase PreA subunit